MRFWFLRNFRKRREGERERERLELNFARLAQRGDLVCPLRFKFPRVERGQELAREAREKKILGHREKRRRRESRETGARE